MQINSRRLSTILISLASLAFGLGLFSASADAGNYNVIQCGAGINNDPARTSSIIQTGTHIGSTCSTTAADQWTATQSGFLRFRSDGAGTVSVDRKAEYTWTAPANTEINSVVAYVQSENAMQGGWRLRFIKRFAGGSETVDKSMCTDVAVCLPVSNNQIPISNIGWDRKQTSLGAPFAAFRIRLECVRPSGCDRVPVTELKINSLRINLVDSINPATSVVANPFTSGAWVRGTQSATLNGNDSESGWYQSLLRTGGNPVSQSATGIGCSILISGVSDIFGENGRSFQPCPTTGQSGSLNVDTSQFASGSRQFSYCGIDFSRNEGCTNFTAQIDNTAPSAVSTPNPSSQVGNGYTVNTSANDAHSGLARVEYMVAPWSGDPLEFNLWPFLVTPSCNDSSAPYTCNFDLSALPDGTRIAFLVRTFDNVGNVSSESLTGPPGGTFINRSSPSVQIDSGPALISNSTTAGLTFSANRAMSSYECKLDAGAWASCLSPTSYLGLGDGGHQFSVRGLDTLANPSNTAVYDWTIDTDPPELTLVDKPPLQTGSSEATFSFIADESPVTFECRLDAASWAACLTPLNLIDLAPGSHTFRARAIDAAGNVSPEQTWTWTIGSLPEVTIDSGPAALVNQRSASLVFSSSDPAATLECQLDLGIWAACLSPQNLSGLIDGPHEFRTRATNNVGTGPVAVWNWSVDASAPVIIILGPEPGATIPTGNPEFVIETSEPATLECRIGSGYLSEATPAWQPFVSCDSGDYQPGPLADGKYTVQFRATDPAGNSVNLFREFSVDTTAPIVNLTRVPAKETDSNRARFEFVSNESPITFECQLDARGWSPCTSPENFSDLPDGNHSFRVRGTDSAGNISFPATYSWLVDRENKKCKLSFIRSRLFVFVEPGPQFQAIRLVARYQAYDRGSVRIQFYEKGPGINLGRRVGNVRVNFKRSIGKFSTFRVRRGMPPAMLKRMRNSRRGFVAIVQVDNVPGYCNRAFYRELELTQKRIVSGQNVWFQKGSFK